MQSYAAPPIRIIEERKAVEVSEPRPQCYRFDFAQNFTGNVRLEGEGMKKGQKLIIRYGVTEGDFDGDLGRSERATDTYVCKGEGVEEWAPKFTLHTFRFAEVEGLLETPEAGFLTGLVTHTDTPLTSGFECSDEQGKLGHPIL